MLQITNQTLGASLLKFVLCSPLVLEISRQQSKEEPDWLGIGVVFN